MCCADVTFYQLGDDGNPTKPVLYLDTLKVSTIEQTAEEAEATGGKGNTALIIWDYGKEITVTLEDALFSAKSMAIMFGNGTVKQYEGDEAFIMKTEQFTASGTAPTAVPTTTSAGGWNAKFEHDGKLYTKENAKFYTEDGTVINTSNLSQKWVAGAKLFCSFYLKLTGSIIEISAASFPGTYYVTGDTYARNEVSGKDEFFQFIIPKAKVQSENTITLEAEGDPSVFNMNLRVLRPTDGKMMKLVKYNLAGEGTAVTEGETTLVHNHQLDENNMDDLDAEG